MRVFLSTLALVFALPLAAHAHKAWLLPSQTTFSGSDSLVTVDAAISNDLFYFNHRPMSLDNLTITGPDGQSVEAENKASGRYRSVFDVALPQEGTYQIAVRNGGLFASWEENGEQKRFRGSAEEFAKKVPADAKNLVVSESIGRIETFVTNGAPTTKALEPADKGIDLVPVTHPNDLYAGDEGRFRLVVDGKPAGGLNVTIVRGGTRYRDSQDEIIVTTDEKGEFAVKFAEPGMYWLETSTTDDKTSTPLAKQRRLSYSATLEVLPQ
jgi:uncharacterized GH25 family protein